MLRAAGRRIVAVSKQRFLWNATSTTTPSSSSSSRAFSSSSIDEEHPRESMPFDVLIVGGGPAGLAASIRLKQLCMEHNHDLSVCLIEKGSEVGAHILSGNVLDPKALNELFPDSSKTDNDWTSDLYEKTGSYATPVTQDVFSVLTETSSYTIPSLFLPPQLDNEGNYIVSLGQVCRWLAMQAEELGVEIYPGFAASEVLYDSSGSMVKGIATRDVGLDKSGQPKETFERGMELHARQTLFAEGARGSCSEEVISKFKLREGKDEQTYGLGIKEVWELPPEQFQAGLVQHTLGYPLQESVTSKVFGGTFLYHQEPNLCLIGMVVGLDYANPYLNPYQEFQRWKLHPSIRPHLEGGSTCISYGARVLNEGGYHAIPKLTMPGACLIGCSAGFLNGVKIKGTHTALKSGMLAAQAAFDKLLQGSSVAESGEIQDYGMELTNYQQAVDTSWITSELKQVRNCHAAFGRWGLSGGLLYNGLACHVTKGKEPWTLSHSTRDADTTQEVQHFQPIQYPAPDGILTFDLLTNLQRSGTYHAEDQPSHLRIKPELAEVPESISLQVYGAPEQRFCPAQVYEYDDDTQQLVINAQNCIHCKCCSIKMPHEYIQWTVPEGGGGPQYQVM